MFVVGFPSKGNWDMCVQSAVDMDMENTLVWNPAIQIDFQATVKSEGSSDEAYSLVGNVVKVIVCWVLNTMIPTQIL